MLGEKHPLVNDRATAQRANVEIVQVFLDHLCFNPSPDDIEIALELVVGNTRFAGDHDLLNFGPRCVGLFTDHLDIERHLPPPVDRIAKLQNLRLDNAAATFLTT